MTTETHGIPRRAVIEAYAAYDVAKKNRSKPDFDSWDWSTADAIDEEMRHAGLKVGIPAGYLFWDEVAVTLGDLLLCAVDGNIFPGQPRRLDLVAEGKLQTWSRHCNNLWYKGIATGHTLNDVAPMLLRPAVRCERPASWYVEDGSGRAIAFVANRHLFGTAESVATGFLGREPDKNSHFMRAHFSELL